jgi:hypothetical protein
MKTLTKEHIRTLTLVVGILTALLLIFGSFATGSSNGTGENIFSWVYNTVPISEVINFSSSVINTLISFKL